MTDSQADRMCRALHAALSAAAPVESVALSPGNVAPAVVQYARTATQPQLAAAAQVLATWDYAPRVPQTQAQLAAQIHAQAGAPGYAAILEAAAAVVLLANPDLALALGLSPETKAV